MDRPEPGIYFGVSYDEYAAWEGVRSTQLRTMYDKTPAHYRYLLDHPNETETPSMTLGRATHTAILEPDRFDSEYILHPETYTNEKGDERPWHGGAKACKEWVAARKAAGQTVLSADDYARCCGMRDAVWESDGDARALVKAGKSEVCVVWNDAETGLPCKARIDLYIEQTCGVVDLKTARTAQQQAFGSAAYRMGYLAQVCFYFDGVKAVTGTEGPLPAIIAAESSPPYPVAVYRVPDVTWLETGRFQYAEALRKVRRCQEKDRWPGYPKKATDLVFPTWAGTELGLAPGDWDDDDEDESLGIV